MVRGNAPKGQTGEAASARRSTAKGTLLVGDVRRTDVRKKPRMGRSASGIVLTGLAQAELSVHRQADVASVLVLLSVVFPPANRAKRHGASSLQRLVSTAWAAKRSLHGCLAGMDGLEGCWVYARLSPQAWSSNGLKLIRIGTNGLISHERRYFHHACARPVHFQPKHGPAALQRKAPASAA